MISISNIMTAINKILVLNYPTYPVYIQRCPEDFERPSFFIQNVKSTVNDANCKMVEKTVYMLITGLGEKDSYYISDINKLNDLQDNIINIFNSCSLKIGDRNIKLKSSSSGFDNDSIFVDLQLSFFDNRTDKVDDTPLIVSVEMNTSLLKK